MRPWSDKQKTLCNVHMLPERFIYAHGAVRSGKTAAALFGLVNFSLLFSGQVFALLAKTRRQSERVVMREVLTASAELDIRVRRLNAKEYLVGDNLFVLFDGVNVSSVPRIQGETYAGVYVDEVKNMPEEIMWELDNRLSVPGAKLLMTSNPEGISHWFETEWHDRQDEIGMRSIHFLMDDNPKLTDEFKESVKRTSRKHHYVRRVEGRPADPYGLVWEDYAEPMACPHRFADANHFILGVDPADSSVTHATLFGKFEDAWWCLGEWRYDGNEQGHMPQADQADAIRRWVAAHGIKLKYAVCDSANQAFRHQLRQALRVPVNNASKDRKAGLDRVEVMLSTHQLRLTDQTPWLVKEIRGYRWDPKKAKAGIDDAVREHCHGPDSVRYAMMSLSAYGMNLHVYHVR